MFDVHRHDEYSTFDGFGKATELAAYAYELGVPLVMRVRCGYSQDKFEEKRLKVL